MMKLMLDDPLKKNDRDAEDNDADCRIQHPWTATWSSLLKGSSFNLFVVNDPPEDEDDHEEDAGAKEATSASIEPLVGHPRAIVAH